MRVAAAFASAAWLGIVAAGAVGVYGFDQYALLYGTWTTFMMILWYAAIPSAVAGFGAWMGSWRLEGVKRQELVVASFAFGVGAFALMLAAGWYPVLAFAFYAYLFVVPLVGLRRLSDSRRAASGPRGADARMAPEEPPAA